jgi:hypothetical protein
MESSSIRMRTSRCRVHRRPCGSGLNNIAGLYGA